MYDISQLKRGLANPNLVVRELNRLYHRRLNTRKYNTGGVDIFAEDWDLCLLLDACRYDMFESTHTLPGRLERRTSRASSTSEFLMANVDGRDLRDTVYVTGNPQLYWNRDSIDARFHAVVDVWRADGWDEEEDTVLPETMTEAAIQAAAEYPEKRLLVHYIQPHYPFVGAETGFDKEHISGGNDDVRNMWNRLMEGGLDVDRDRIWELYVDNLRGAMGAVERAMREIRGKTVVTSDHGNMVGERARPFPIREWGHPRGIYTDELVTVPWLIQEADERRTITAGAAASRDPVADDDVVADRLEHLGYVE